MEQWLELPPDAITFISTPGVAPRLMIDGLPEPGFSISHEAGFSLAAINLNGAVGVDLMQVQPVPDWQVVAQDYLGPDVGARLRDVCEATRSVAFARAWCEREAFLKLHGRELGEWIEVGQLEGVGIEVELGTNMVGVVALEWPVCSSEPSGLGEQIWQRRLNRGLTQTRCGAGHDQPDSTYGHDPFPDRNEFIEWC